MWSIAMLIRAKLVKNAANPCSSQHHASAPQTRSKLEYIKAGILILMTSAGSFGHDSKFLSYLITTSGISHRRCRTCGFTLELLLPKVHPLTFEKPLWTGVWESASSHCHQVVSKAQIVQ